MFPKSAAITGLSLLLFVTCLPTIGADVTFEDVTEAAGLAGLGGDLAAWADYDNDGLPDLYVASGITGSKLPNRLYHNAAGKLVELEDSPLAVFRNTYQATFSDYDGDGDQDVYVANDFAPNNMFRNEGGLEFLDVTAES
ncbi:MAG: VCBS repeat-containing protein, partial [Lentisphaeria bacterium]|nr:VCBS repeat-containing protein [Lentisphaeria bacterium]